MTNRLWLCTFTESHYLTYLHLLKSIGLPETCFGHRLPWQPKVYSVILLWNCNIKACTAAPPHLVIIIILSCSLPRWSIKVIFLIVILITWTHRLPERCWMNPDCSSAWVKGHVTWRHSPITPLWVYNYFTGPSANLAIWVCVCVGVWHKLIHICQSQHIGCSTIGAHVTHRQREVSETNTCMQREGDAVTVWTVGDCGGE